MQFFISHSSSDHAWVEQLRKLIEQQGFIAYLAEQDHEPGTNLNAKLEAAVAASDAFVAFLTDAASTSGIVHAEIGYARALKKPIFPLVAPEVAQDPAALGMLNGLEYVLFDISDPQSGLLSLVEWA